MSILLDEIKLEWDPEDPTHILLELPGITLNLDQQSARNLAAGLSEMADRVDRKVDTFLNGLDAL